MIRGIQPDFIQRGSDLRSASRKGASDTGSSKSGFESLFERESERASERDSVATDDGRSGVNAAQSSPLLRNDEFVPGASQRPVIQESAAKTESVKKATIKGSASTGDSASVKTFGGESRDTERLAQAIQNEQGAVRRQAMEDFMTSMKEEFGIEPEKILEAFAKLDGTSLVATPEDSAKEFLANLQLPSDQQARAAQLYQRMLSVTGEAALNEKLIGLESGVNLDIVSPRDQALRDLNSSIEDLNEAFAMRGHAKVDGAASGPETDVQRAQVAIERMDAQLARMIQQKMEQKAQQTAQDPRANATGDKSKSEALEFAALGLASAATAGAALGTDAVDASSGSTNAGQVTGDFMNSLSVSPENANQGLGAESSDDGGNFSGLLNQQPGQQAAQMASSAPTPERGADVFGDTVASKGAKKVSVKGVASSSEAVASANASEMNATVASIGTETKVAGGADLASSGPAAMMMDRPTPTSQDEQANVRELIRQAQVVLKQGGGEIKMDMKPEGMGPLRLKISVHDGQVNVQMLTESDAAKRLLEKGLNELRSDLTAHNLKVESMKVDVGREMQRHMDQQADDQARQQARQYMSDMMGQFRDERNAFRQGFMENSGLRRYDQGRGTKMNPEPVETRGVAGSRSRSASASRLDLVA